MPSLCAGPLTFDGFFFGLGDGFCIASDNGCDLRSDTIFASKGSGTQAFSVFFISAPAKSGFGGIAEKASIVDAVSAKIVDLSKFEMILHILFDFFYSNYD